MNVDPRLGVDIGRVIIDGSAHPGGGDTAFFSGDEATMIATPEMPDAFDTIARLVDRFGGAVWLVSKCGPNTEARTRRWLDGHEFYARTGVDREHLRFCRLRPEKRDHCLALGLTHFVDDHPKVHSAIKGAVRHQYMFGPQADPIPDYVVHAPTWPDVERLIAATWQTEADAAA